jgi:hypothetical protein
MLQPDRRMLRSLLVTEPFRASEISPGVVLGSFYPGGKDGPNREVLNDFPGGQVWTDILVLGDFEADAFQLAVPDIRLPANQIWPLHWHDCWVGIVILDGACRIGDWWMKPGDVLITGAGLEYGPLLIGAQGCRMFEIFARLHLQAGGYAPEYRDHPTLEYATQPFNFAARTGVNRRNEGRQCLPIDGVEGFTKGDFTPGSQWDLGEPHDPERGAMKVSRLAPGEHLAPHAYDDWHALLVVDGSLQTAGQTLVKDDYLLARPQSRLAELAAGAAGALLLEISRTAPGLPRREAPA